MLTLFLCGLQAQNTFNVAAMNVDGLPNTIMGFSLNPDGPGASGTLAISQKLATMGYDIIGVSEDFNYDTELMQFMTSYRCGTFRGGIEASGFNLNITFNTDGLNLLWRQQYLIQNEGIHGWHKKYGKFTNGADELIDKGFRFYQVTINDSLTIDLYIVHMDAETDPQDLAARWSQWSQLTDMILSSNNGNPIVVMGDTNSRYTRDKILDLFTNPLEADGRFTVTDAWIEKEYDGVYPEFGTDALMVWELGYQKGEVVDKVFYINNKQSQYTLSANYYLQDTSFVDSTGSPLADHWPIVVEFTYEKRAYSPGKYHSNVASINWQGEDPTAGGQYYIYNPQSHKFLANNDLTPITVTEPTHPWVLTSKSVNGNVHIMNMFTSAYSFNLRKDGSSAIPSLSLDTQTIELATSATNTTRNAYKIHRTASPKRYLNCNTDGSLTGAQNTGEQNDWLFVSVQQLRDSMRTTDNYEATICHNETYSDAVFTSDLSEEGIYQETLVNHMGYDSVVTLTLHVLPTSECEATALPETKTGQITATKMLINGHLFIRREEVFFDSTGRRINTIHR